MHQTRYIEVVEYNPNWPKMFAAEEANIKQALSKNCLAVHHIGSTSVIGLAAKPEIDILVVVRDLMKLDSLESIGAINKGEFNIPSRIFFSHDYDRMKFNIHVCERNHGNIDLWLNFRDYLKAHPEEALRYGNFKQALVTQNNGLFIKHPICGSSYTLAKDDLIKELIAKSHFTGILLNFCFQENEWKNYHRIRREQIFEPINVIYNEKHPTITASNHYHFILSHGTLIVSVAHIEFLNGKEAVLRSLATDEPYKNHGYGKELLRLLEKWLKQHNKEILKMHSRLSAESFYRKLGFTEIIFDDPCLTQAHIDLGKKL